MDKVKNPEHLLCCQMCWNFEADEFVNHGGLLLCEDCEYQHLQKEDE